MHAASAASRNVTPTPRTTVAISPALCNASTRPRT
jgi:hypothetical protein